MKKNRYKLDKQVGSTYFLIKGDCFRRVPATAHYSNSITSVMECLKEFLLPKRFSVPGYIVALLCGLVGAIIIGLTAVLRANEEVKFRCESHSRIPDKDFLQTKCYNQYDEIYNSPLSLNYFVILSFSTLVGICITYSLCVKSRVDQIEDDLKTNPENPRRSPRRTTRRVYWAYLIHLLVRFGLGSFFAVFQALHYLNYPSQFHCNYDISKPATSVHLNATQSNSSLLRVKCEHPRARDKEAMGTTAFGLHIVFAFAVFVEIIYLITNACRNEEFTHDSIFCKTHLEPNKENSHELPENFQPLIPSLSPEDNKELAVDDVYIELIIHSGRITHEFPGLENRNELMHVYLTPPDNSVRINNREELFLSDQQSYTKILIVGRPGIGKSLLCTKIIREWSQGALSQFKHVFLYRFRDFISEAMSKMSLKEFLSRAEYPTDFQDYQSVIDQPDKVLFIFDGLDEYKHHDNFKVDELLYRTINSVVDEMPVSALYVKLLQNKLLSGATVLTTTRSHAIDSVTGINEVEFDRDVEILGFTPEKVELYVQKFCKDDLGTANRIWQHIDNSINLLYLCYIPATCNIVCSLLQHDLNLLHGGLHSISLPTTLTDVYKGALSMFLSKHHPEYPPRNQSDTFPESVEKDLSNLGKLARQGIHKQQLIFEEEEVKEIRECGLLNSMPSKKNPPFGVSRSSQYCFLHLTLQEFLAARNIVRTMNPKKIADFIKDKITNTSADWHLVIQFIAGLLKDRDDVTEVINCIVKTLCDSLTGQPLYKRLALLMMRCLYELKDENVAKKAAFELQQSQLNFGGSGITPLDCTCIVYLLRHVNPPVKELGFSDNFSIGASGCAQLALLLKERSPERLYMYDCNITDEGVKTLFGEMDWEKPCPLTYLELGNNKITDDGMKYLCEVLKKENCQLTELRPHRNELITDIGVSDLCTALIHENCQLTHLLLEWIEITNKGVLHLSDALIHENCQLTHLDLSLCEEIADKCVLHLRDALMHGHCQVTHLNIWSYEWHRNVRHSGITDKGLSYLCEALIHVNCKLSSLSIESIRITDKGVSHVCEALKHNNCKLTVLFLQCDSITDKSIPYLCEALKDKNCKLIELKLGLDDKVLTDHHNSQLREAICKRVK